MHFCSFELRLVKTASTTDQVAVTQQFKPLTFHRIFIMTNTIARRIGYFMSERFDIREKGC